jgi:hypothetical protein
MDVIAVNQRYQLERTLRTVEDSQDYSIPILGHELSVLYNRGNYNTTNKEIWGILIFP